MKFNLEKLLAQFIEFDSSCGKEAEVCSFAYDLLASIFPQVVKIPVSGQRFNLLAYNQLPKIVFSTHLDVVKADNSLFVPRMESGRIYGRGACDAKGIAVCMLEACAQLKEAGCDEQAILFVVGEETVGDGAAAAKPILNQFDTRFVINGEPTQSKIIASQFGACDFKLTIQGKSAHSGYPERGLDANRALLKNLISIEELLLANDQNTLVNFGKIEAGQAANIVSSIACAEMCIRSELPSLQVENIIELALRNLPLPYLLEKTFESQALRPMVIPGFDCDVAKFASDLPTLLSAGMRGVLFGPGDIHLAHTDKESIALEEMQDGIEGYKKIFNYLRGQNA